MYPVWDICSEQMVVLKLCPLWCWLSGSTVNHSMASLSCWTKARTQDLSERGQECFGVTSSLYTPAASPKCCFLPASRGNVHTVLLGNTWVINSLRFKLLWIRDGQFDLLMTNLWQMQSAATHFVCNNNHYDQVEALFCSLQLSLPG